MKTKKDIEKQHSYEVNRNIQLNVQIDRLQQENEELIFRLFFFENFYLKKTRQSRGKL